MFVETGAWGNSLGIRIPKILVKEYSIKAGTKLKVELTDNGFYIEPVAENDMPKFTLSELVADISSGKKHKEIGWGSDAGKEIAEW